MARGKSARRLKRNKCHDQFESLQAEASSFLGNHLGLLPFFLFYKRELSKEAAVGLFLYAKLLRGLSISLSRVVNQQDFLSVLPFFSPLLPPFPLVLLEKQHRAAHPHERRQARSRA